MPQSVLILGSFLFVTFLAIVGYYIFKAKPTLEAPVIKPDEMPSLGVVYFENKSGDANLDNWRDAFCELLIIDLSQSRYLRILRSDEIYSILKELNLLEVNRYSTDDLRRIAKRGRVNHILKGSYMKAGQNFVITTMIINTDTGETLRSLSRKAEGENNIFPKVDELTREIKLILTSRQIAEELDEEVSKITTSSTEALKYYMQGLKCNKEGDFRNSIEFMKKAVVIDPKFAMAYRYMAYNCYFLGLTSESVKYRKKAMEFIKHISVRERYIIQGEYYSYIENNAGRAIESYNKGLQLYPYDVQLNVKLSHIYRNVEEFDKAIESLQVLIQNKEPDAYIHICVPYCAKGLYEKAIEAAQYYISNFQDNVYARMELVWLYSIQRKFDLALSEIEKASILMSPEKFWSIFVREGFIYLYLEDFSEVEKIYQMHREDKEIGNQLQAKKLIGCLYLLQGRFTEAEYQFRQAKKMSKTLGSGTSRSYIAYMIGYMYLVSKKYEAALREFNESLVFLKEYTLVLWEAQGKYLKALTLLEMDSSDGAKKAEEELLKCTNNSRNKKIARYYYLFMGKKELKNEKYSKSIQHLNKAISLLPHQGFWEESHALFIEPLALAYFKSGKLEKARKEYEKITSLTFGRDSYGDIYAKSFYQLGKIHERKDRKGKAIENYGRFINLWKDSDPQLKPIIEDARKRMKDLEGAN
jgi:tetratricopeptide (TPR) repeat protein